MKPTTRPLHFSLGLLVVIVLMAASCASTTESTTIELAEPNGHNFGSTLEDFTGTTGGEVVATPPPDGFTEVTWDDLVPDGFSGAEISARFDARIAEVEPGSPEADEVFAELQAAYEDQPVNAELSGNAVQIAGFVAPLTYSGDIITEFLLVPYFGACIHVPPPPVNQTVMVSLADGEGLTIDESWGPVWVAGTLAVDAADTELATAGYTINAAQTGVYDQY